MLHTVATCSYSYINLQLINEEIINEERVQYPASYVQGKIFAPIQYKPKNIYKLIL